MHIQALLTHIFISNRAVFPMKWHSGPSCAFWHSISLIVTSICDESDAEEGWEHDYLISGGRNTYRRARVVFEVLCLKACDAFSVADREMLSEQGIHSTRATKGSSQFFSPFLSFLVCPTLFLLWLMRLLFVPPSTPPALNPFFSSKQWTSEPLFL